MLHAVADKGGSPQGPRAPAHAGLGGGFRANPALARDGKALRAARQLVLDLALWRAGTIGWHDLSRSHRVFGPPATVKTWLARAIGNDANLSVIAGSFAEWQAAGHLGDMLRAMRESFAEGRKQTPSVLIIDEIDAAGSR